MTGELATRMFDPAATIADLSWLPSARDGPLIVKGIHTVGLSGKRWIWLV